jgi:hypothetical protein
VFVFCWTPNVTYWVTESPLDWLHCLFPTPLVVITIFILQRVLTLWCLLSERSLDLFCGSSVSVCPECWQLTDWLFTDSSLLCPLSESESYVTTDGQSGSLSWYKAPIWGLRPDFFFAVGQLRVCWYGALSLTRGRVCRLQLLSRPVPYLCLSPLKSSLCVWNRRHLFSRLYLPSQQFGCLGNLTVKNCWVAVG